MVIANSRIRAARIGLLDPLVGSLPATLRFLTPTQSTRKRSGSCSSSKKAGSGRGSNRGCRLAPSLQILKLLIFAGE
jgi:hypothetical protein